MNPIILYTLFLVGICDLVFSEEIPDYLDVAAELQVALYTQDGRVDAHSDGSGLRKNDGPLDAHYGRPEGVMATMDAQNGPAGHNDVHNDHSMDTHSVDLATANPSVYQAFDFHYNDNPMMLIVPQNGVSIVTIMAGPAIIWEAQPDEQLKYARAYLNSDEQPELISVVSKTPSKRVQKYLELRFGEWIDCTEKHAERIKALKLHIKNKIHFAIDLSLDHDSEQCRIFGSTLVERPFRSYAPRPGYLAKEVKDGSASLWKGETRHEHCPLATIYLREDSPYLLYIDIVVMGTRVPQFFVKNGHGSGWKSLQEKEFRRMANHLRSLHTEL